MKEDVQVFARKASGLTREASLFDAVYFGVLNNAIPVSLWFILAAFGWLPGANLTIAALLTLVLTVFGFAFVWGILGGSMPRSGGSYVYNSRIIHPAVGLGVSITNGGFVMLAWIWVLAPWIGEYGLPIMVGSLGFDVSTVAWATSGWGLYALTTVVNIGAFLVVMAGMKFYFKLQKVLISWSIIGAVIAGIIISVTSYDKFVEIWNTYAAQYNSLDFTATVAAASDAIGGIPATWNWTSTLGLMLPISWIAVYGYIITFIGGEVKSPRKSIFIAQILNAVVCIAFLLWVGLVYMKMLGWEGLHAMAYISEESLEGMNLPFIPTYIGIASLIVGFNKILGFIMAGAFIVATFMWVVVSYVAWSRAAFAWGMDRLGPRWFTDISPRFNQPVKLLLVMLVLSQIAITQYAFNPEALGGVSVEVMQLVSVFGITAISAMIFPFVKKARHIWDSSPYREWKIFRIPVTTIVGFIAFAFVVLLIFSYYINEAFAFMHTWWTVIYVFVWIFGIIWYFIWKGVRKRDGIDVTMAFKEIPPE
jgi:basic amino acid/polyamine antiporter, APA family